MPSLPQQQAEQETLIQFCVGCGNPQNPSTPTMYWSSTAGRQVHICHRCYTISVWQCPGCNYHITRNLHSIDTRVLNVREALNAQETSWYATDDTQQTLCDFCTYSCDSCEARYEYEDNQLECCEEADHRGWIHNYSYRPTYKFYREIGDNTSCTNSRTPVLNRLYMGFEIEVAKVASHMNEFYRLAPENYDEPRFTYAKDDASIGANGAEFVTMPATLKAFEIMFPWETFERLHELGARAWAYDSCGMHIHVSRSAFSPSHLYKFMKFQLMNDALCIAYAGRESNFANWYNNTMEEVKSKTSQYCKTYTYGERYSAINVTPRTTIELRYFKSNITKEGILRNAQWVDAIYEYTKIMHITTPRLNRWNYEPFIEFLNNQPKYNLAAKYVERVWE